MHVPTARAAKAALLFLRLSALLLALASACRAGTAARAYVWQRSWGGALRTALDAHHAAFTGLDILAGELSWRDGRLIAEPVAPDWTRCGRLGTPLGLVLRIGPCPSHWAPEAPETHQVIRAFGDCLARAEAAGARVTELQCDFDASVAQLADYARLLHSLRLAFPGHRLVATSLPAWLGSPAFRSVIVELDAFVLQVHSLEKPSSPEAAYTLCPPERARRWIDAASGLGRPFRVALPSYGYLLGFGADGRFRRLQAEGSPRPDPVITRWVPVMADPFALAALVRDLDATRPSGLEAICWFRLPAGSEERNWSWETLELVMQGRDPAPELQARVSKADDGSLLVCLRNGGSWRGRIHRILAEWKEGRLQAADALAGWRVAQRNPQALSLEPAKADTELAPGEELTVAWLRLSPAAEPQLRLE